MLSIKNLSLAKKKTILSQISLEIPSGAITLFLGKSGSGKTTLLRCIAQLESSYEGEISLFEKPLRSLASKERSQTIGFVPQAYALFPHMTLLDNCTAPLRHLSSLRKSAAQDLARQTLASLDMEPLALSYPHELSGGQQQRAAIARALLLNPRYLLLDEPTSALDPENTKRLIQILYTLREKGMGLIISSQDMAFAKEIYDAAIFLEEGRIIERSNETLPKEGKLRQYLEI